MAKEADIQRSILDYLSYKRAFHWRQNSGIIPIRNRVINMGVVGAPDIFVIKNGAIYGLEVKAPKGKQNENQIAFQEGFEKAGGKYYVVRSLEDVQAAGL